MTNSANVQLKMSTQKAYGLLAVALMLVYLSLKPAITQLIQQENQIEALTQQGLQAKQHQSQKEQKQQAYIEALQAKILDGQLSLQSQPSKVAEELQNSLKTAASKSTASIKTLQPENNLGQQSINEHSLDASFIIGAKDIGRLLNELAKQQPTPRVKMMSLRMNQFASSTGTKISSSLSGQLLLSQHSLSPSLHSDLFAEKPNSESVTELEYKLRPETQAPVVELASLFKASLRSRERNPSLNFYRLSAITGNAQQRSVLITDKELGSSTRLNIGDSLAGWKLQSIDGQSITMSKDGQTKVLSLN